MTEEIEEETGMDPEDIVKVINAMPQEVNVVGMAELFANALDAYDMKSKARDVLMITAMMVSGKAEMRFTRVEAPEVGRVN